MSQSNSFFFGVGRGDSYGTRHKDPEKDLSTAYRKQIWFSTAACTNSFMDVYTKAELPANTEPGVHYIHTHALPFGHVCLWWKKHTYCGCSPDKPTRTLTAWRLRTHRLTNQVQSAYKGTIQQCLFPFQPSFYSFSILHTTMLPMQFGYVMLLTPVYRSLLTTVAVRQWFLYSAMRCGVGVTLRERRAAWQVKRLHWE